MCPAGQFSPNGKKPCTDCPKGKYQPESGSKECLTCPGDTMTVDEGSKSVDACKGMQSVVIYLMNVKFEVKVTTFCDSN